VLISATESSIAISSIVLVSVFMLFTSRKPFEQGTGLNSFGF
jgi:hypothetical protein